MSLRSNVRANLIKAQIYSKLATGEPIFWLD